jgi:hypothetical protein
MEDFKIAAVGDTHANMEWVCNLVIPYAKRHGCKKIFQVGDFGFVWSGDGEENNRLRKLDRILSVAGMDLHFLPGNHENHDLLADYARRGPASPEGHFAVRPHIFYTGRVSSWEWAGRKIAAVGGAVSIDRKWRQQEQRLSGKPLWWKQETLNSYEVQHARGLDEVELLFTHDAPTSFPEQWLKADLESTMNRQVMTDIGRALKPKGWVHGHYHCKINYAFEHDEGTCDVLGLNCDGYAVEASVAILNLGNNVDKSDPEM